MPTEDERVQREANRLYWESDASVSQTAERLGVSRRALYDLLHPYPAGVSCPNCGGMLAYRNRMGRTAGEVECPDCGREESVAALREATADAGPALRREADEREAERAAGDAAGRAARAEADRARASASRRASLLDSLEPEERDRALVLGAAAVAGVVVGIAAALVFRRR